MISVLVYSSSARITGAAQVPRDGVQSPCCDDYHREIATLLGGFLLSDGSRIAKIRSLITEHTQPLFPTLNCNDVDIVLAVLLDFYDRVYGQISVVSGLLRCERVAQHLRVHGAGQDSPTLHV